MTKTIKTDNDNKLTIIGNGHFIEIEYCVPEWNEDEPEAYDEACFRYKGHTYFLSEFMITEMEDFDGFRGDSYFSGIGIKLSECGDGVQAYTCYS